MSLISINDFNNKTPFEQLDFILDQFIKNNAFKGHISDGDVIKEMFGKDSQQVNSDMGSIIISILNQLCDDKYLNSEIRNGISIYFITFKGRFFYQKGSYCKLLEIEASDKDKFQKSERHQRDLQISMNVLTVILTLGTLVQSLYCTVQMLDGNNVKPHPCIAYFLLIFVPICIIGSIAYHQNKYKL